MKCPICRENIELVGVEYDQSNGRVYRCGCGEYTGWTFLVLPLPPAAEEMIMDAFKLSIERGKFKDGVFGLGAFVESCVAYSMPEILEV